MNAIPINSNKEKSQKDIQKGLQYLQTPCTVAETVQISREIAQEVLAEEQQHTQPWQVAVSLQLEILKEVVINAGIITEDEFREKYVERMSKVQQMQQEIQRDELESTEDVKMDVKADDIVVEKV